MTDDNTMQGRARVGFATMLLTVRLEDDVTAKVPGIVASSDVLGTW